MSRLKKILIKLILSFAFMIFYIIYPGRESFLDAIRGDSIFHTFLKAIFVIIFSTSIVYQIFSLLWITIKLAGKNILDFINDGISLKFLIEVLFRCFSFGTPILVWGIAGSYIIEWFKPDITFFEGLLLFVYFSMVLWIDLIRWYIEEYR